jgi:hypothetical protein
MVILCRMPKLSRGAAGQQLLVTPPLDALVTAVAVVRTAQWCSLWREVE